LDRKRWVIMIVAAALGGGLSLAVGSCGGEDRGSVEIEDSTSGTGTSTSGADTSTGETSTGETSTGETTPAP